MSEVTINMGPGTYSIPLTLFRDNRSRVCAAMKNENGGSAVDEKSYILLQGGDSISFYDTDTEHVFRQVTTTSLFLTLSSSHTITPFPWQISGLGAKIELGNCVQNCFLFLWSNLCNEILS